MFSFSKIVEKTSMPSYVFIIDDITDPVPFNKTLDTVYLSIQLSPNEITK